MNSRWREILIGLPPQRSMTPEESANLAAYHKTKFQRVPAQDDGLREEVPIIHGRAELAAHDAALIQKRDREWALVCAEHDIAALANSSGTIKLNPAALRASVRGETLDAVIPAIIKWLSENPKWPIMSRLNSSLRKAAEASFLASEKAASTANGRCIP